MTRSKWIPALFLFALAVFFSGAQSDAYAIFVSISNNTGCPIDVSVTDGTSLCTSPTTTINDGQQITSNPPCTPVTITVDGTDYTIPACNNSISITTNCGTKTLLRELDCSGMYISIY